MKAAVILFIKLYILILLISFQSCASRGRPGGGPVDKIPPTIVSTFPLPDSVGVTGLDQIEIVFSERMKEAAVQNSIFISPPMDYEVDWSGGTDLVLELKKPLEENRTYVITIGTGATDARDNRMTESFHLAFSTGSQLDKGRISGTVYGIQKQDLFYIYGYRITDPDSLNPTINKADFLSQTAENGEYSLNYLPEGEFRIFAVEDQNRNLVLDANFERVGIPFKDVMLDSSRMQAHMVNFMITSVDTVPPALTGAKSAGKNKVLLRFSEPVIMPQNITIYDTVSTDTLRQMAGMFSRDGGSQVYLYTTDQDSGADYRIMVDELADSSGNKATKRQLADFKGTSLIDTSGFTIMDIAPKDSARNVKYPVSVKFNFSQPVDTTLLYRSFLCTAGESDTLAGRWQTTELTDFLFQPEGGFVPGNEYRYIIDSQNIRSLWDEKLPDTLIDNRFFMLSQDEFGSISGSTTLDEPQISYARINVYRANGLKFVEELELSSTNQYIFPWLSAGEYRLGGYLDLNNDAKYSPGSLFPFQFAEPFFIASDTVTVRKRWESAEILLRFPEAE